MKIVDSQFELARIKFIVNSQADEKQHVLVRHLWLHNHASHPKTEFVKNEVLNLCCDIWSVNHKLITDEEFTSDIDAGKHATY